MLGVYPVFVPSGDIVTDLLLLLIEQFRSYPELPAQKLIDIIEEMLLEGQEAYDSMLELGNDRFISTAIGVQLDGCGEIVNETRSGRDDDDYRDALYAKVKINIGSGEPESIIDALSFVTSAALIRLIERYPAGIEVWLDDYGWDSIYDIGKLVQRIVSAGVDAIVTASSVDVLPFSFDTTLEGGVAETGGCLGELDYTWPPSPDPAPGALTELI